MPRRPTFEEFAYWGTFLFAAVIVGYLLITLISLSSEEESAFQSATNYRDRVRLVTVLTSEGSFTIAFMRSEAPLTVKNFVKLAQSGFYDKTEFYNFHDGVFVENVASGDTATPQLEGANARVGQIFEEGAQNIEITRGLVAMPARGESLVDSRQLLFFIEDDPVTRGEGYAVFGRVISGMDVVERISGITPKTANTASTAPVSLESIVVD
ncbi:MAG: peptidylprolyl isomerase [bacterium]|nr:peptidylprolyl isomerase [bacterium]